MKPKRNLQEYICICKSIADKIFIVEVYLKKDSPEYK